MLLASIRVGSMPTRSLLVIDCWLLIVGCWLLIDCWLLVVGCWLLAVVCWLLSVAAPLMLDVRVANFSRRCFFAGGLLEICLNVGLVFECVERGFF